MGFLMTVPFSAKYVIAVIVLCGVLLVTGCANTVTKKDTLGRSFGLTITFKSSPNFNNYNYYLVYADKRFIVDSQVASTYFFIPGAPYNVTAVNNISGNRGIDYMYNNYFYSWGGIITLKEQDVSITRGPFPKTASDDTHYGYAPQLLSLNTYSVSSTTLSFMIPIDELNLTSSELFFMLITTTTSNGLGNTQDRMSSIQSIELIANSPKQTGNNNASLLNPAAAADIESWTFWVQ
jgi:hypothetical protein